MLREEDTYKTKGRIKIGVVALSAAFYFQTEPTNLFMLQSVTQLVD